MQNESSITELCLHKYYHGCAPGEAFRRMFFAQPISQRTGLKHLFTIPYHCKSEISSEIAQRLIGWQQGWGKRAQESGQRATNIG